MPRKTTERESAEAAYDDLEMSVLHKISRAVARRKNVHDLISETLEILDGSMTVVVEDGKVYVSHSDCPEQLCVHSAPLTAAGGMTVCLPNKVIVKIDSGEVDAIS